MVEPVRQATDEDGNVKIMKKPAADVVAADRDPEEVAPKPKIQECDSREDRGSPQRSPPVAPFERDQHRVRDDDRSKNDGCFVATEGSNVTQGPSRKKNRPPATLVNQIRQQRQQTKGRVKQRGKAGNEDHCIGVQRKQSK